ncbi:unnamed protein product [Rotaria sp. Silwood1]|nr:unnamed protein product [Rotaria sp. Silwood1]
MSSSSVLPFIDNEKQCFLLHNKLTSQPTTRQSEVTKNAMIANIDNEPTVDTEESLTATQIHDELTTAYGHGVVSYCTVTRWIQRFSNERESLEDNPRSGCPITAITQQNIDAVNDLVNDDLHISIDYIAIISDMSITCVIVMNV